MSNPTKAGFLSKLASLYGTPQKLDQSQSLYDIPGSAIRIYIRYSKIHSGDRAFYGLRKDDLKKLEGKSSVICFLWDGQKEPLLVPFDQYEDVFYSTSPAKGGQYKAQIYLREDNIELYISQAGHFNIEGQFGWQED